MPPWEAHETDAEQNDGHKGGADVRHERANEGQRAEQERAGESQQERAERGQQSEHEIDGRDRADLAQEIIFDLVEHSDCAQSCFGT